MNRKLIILGIGFLYLQEVRPESFFEQARLGVGKLADIVFGSEDASPETQKKVQELSQKMGIRRPIPVKKMNLLARLIAGYENAFVLYPGLVDRMYINEKWTQEELSEEERTFLLSHEVAHVKHKDWLSINGIDALLNMPQLYIMYKLLGTPEENELWHLFTGNNESKGEKLWRLAKAYMLTKFMKIPFDLLRAKYHRHIEKEADLEALHVGATPQGGINLFTKVRDRSLEPHDSWDRKVGTNIRWFLTYIYSLPFLKYYRTHPSLDERIDYLTQIKDKKPQTEE